MTLRLDWCSRDAAEYAVTHWHYSRSLPSGGTVKVGTWEDGRFIGAVVFAMGATPNLAKSHGLPQTELCELARVALDTHRAPVSQIVMIAMRMLKRFCPGLRLVVSFADADQGHIGGIYQACGWLYLGLSNEGGSQGFIVRGRAMHRRSVGSAGWVQSLTWLRANVDPRAREMITAGKHKYVYLFDQSLRAGLELQPYPKRERSRDSAAALPRAEGGASPTRSLQVSRR